MRNNDVRDTTALVANVRTLLKKIYAIYTSGALHLLFNQEYFVKLLKFARRHHNDIYQHAMNVNKVSFVQYTWLMMLSLLLMLGMRRVCG